MPLLVALLVVFLPAAVIGGEPPDVVLVTLDTVRADHMGFLGDRRGLTPRLDALAKEAVVFERIYAQAPITTVSHATILSGTYPSFHGVNDFGVPLPDTVPWLPSALRAHGYHTAAFVGSLILDPRGGFAPGFDRGFDHYEAGFRVRRSRTEDRYGTAERRAGDVVGRAVRWLRTAKGPFFLWVHLYDAHDPYDPPAPRARGHRGYAGEIAAVDAAVGALTDALQARGSFGNTLLAVTSDHGESLGEHGEKTHGTFLYDAVLHVPLLLKPPRGYPGGRRVEARASLVDLAPTLLEAAGAAVPAAVQGESLSRLVEGLAQDRASYAETDYPRRAFGWSSLASFRVDRFLFVQAPRRELYDLRSDPGARRNLAESEARVADRIAQELEAFRRRVSGSDDGGARKREIDPDLAERLAALGYASGTSAPAAGGVDPKDKIAVANDLHAAMLAVEDGDAARAQPLLERVLATDPQIHIAHLQLGIALARQRQYRRALTPLRRAIELQPEAMMAHYEIGVALFETGDLKAAAGHFAIVAARMPKWADARFSLASVYARIDRVADATRELGAALGLEPDHYRANLLLGRILFLQGRATEALPHLLRAARHRSASAEAHRFLADAYERLGRTEEARRARARAGE